MNEKNIKNIIRNIVNETLDMMQEAHDRGEWWIDESGQTTFADIDVGDSGHEAIVIEHLTREILSFFEIEADEMGNISEYEESILETLQSQNNWTPEDESQWNSSGPSEVIVRKLIEGGAFKDAKQAEDAVYIAYGSNTRDARDYAMKHWNWKIMKTVGKRIEIQTWHLKPEDLSIIVNGIWDIMGEEDLEDTNDTDNIVGDDGYPGPRINVTVQATGKVFYDIPLAVMEKKMPQTLRNYQSGVDVGYTESLNEDYHHLHKEYRLYEGNKHIVAAFDDGSRLSFEVHFRNNHGEDRDKWRRKAFTTWKSCANELHSDVELTEVGNPVEKSWKECFKEALKHPKMKEFIRSNHHQKIFGT